MTFPLAVSFALDFLPFLDGSHFYVLFHSKILHILRIFSYPLSFPHATNAILSPFPPHSLPLPYPPFLPGSRPLPAPFHYVSFFISHGNHLVPRNVHQTKRAKKCTFQLETRSIRYSHTHSFFSSKGKTLIIVNSLCYP